MVMLIPGGERESVLSHVAGLRPDQRPDRDGALVADTHGALLVRRDAHGVHGLAMRNTFGGSHALVVGPDLYGGVARTSNIVSTMFRIDIESSHPGRVRPVDAPHVLAVQPVPVRQLEVATGRQTPGTIRVPGH